MDHGDCGDRQADYARRAGELTAAKRGDGDQQIYAPVSDVNNNAANPVINVGPMVKIRSTFRGRGALVVGATGRSDCHRETPSRHGDTATDSHRGLPD